MHFVKPAGQGQGVASEFAIDPASGNGRNWLYWVVDRNIQPQIPASGAGDVELADIGKFGI